MADCCACVGLADGWSGLEEANQAARRAAALEKAVVKALPSILASPQNTKMTGWDIHNKCQETAVSSRVQVDAVIQALDRRGRLTKIGQHYYLDPTLRTCRRREAAAAARNQRSRFRTQRSRMLRLRFFLGFLRGMTTYCDCSRASLQGCCCTSGRFC